MFFFEWVNWLLVFVRNQRSWGGHLLDDLLDRHDLVGDVLDGFLKNSDLSLKD